MYKGPVYYEVSTGVERVSNDFRVVFQHLGPNVPRVQSVYNKLSK